MRLGEMSAARSNQPRKCVVRCGGKEREGSWEAGETWRTSFTKASVRLSKDVIGPDSTEANQEFVLWIFLPRY